MNIKPLGKRITLKPIAEEEVVEGGIVLSQDTKKKMAKAEVLAVGEEVTKVKVGETVIFSPFHYDEIKEDIFVIEEQDIWAIVS